VLGAKICVPLLWFVEVATALVTLERRKKLAPEARAKALAVLDSMKFTVDEDGHRFAFTKVSELVALHGLAAYDAIYLELSLRERIQRGRVRETQFGQEFPAAWCRGA
jgi:predicted nucleic acid-binding protein